MKEFFKLTLKKIVLTILLFIPSLFLYTEIMPIAECPTCVQTPSIPGQVLGLSLEFLLVVFFAYCVSCVSISMLNGTREKKFNTTTPRRHKTK